MENKTSCGVDGISNSLLKSIKSEIVQPVTVLINQMLTTGIFPDKLKNAKVVPLYKKGDNTLFSNYRPISILPSLSKIFERIVYSQLYAYFECNKLLYSSQYGFRQGHSTEFAALELIDKIAFLMQEGKVPVGVFLDMSKAFDTLNHDILLDKLSYLGISGISKDLLASYLSNRQQYVRFDNQNSEIAQITTGVPQGSILGPLLFLTYINDFVDTSTLFNFMLFADDTTIISKIDAKHVNLINKELDKLFLWLELNKLSLNISKSKCMFFHQSQKSIIYPIITINGVEIEKVDNFNFLGLIINKNLKWNSHVNYIASRMSRSIGLFMILRHTLPTDILVLLYNSLILPHMTYCLLAWGDHHNNISLLQKKVLRIITFSKLFAHSEPLLKQLSLIKFEDMVKIQQVKFYYRYLNGNLNCYFLTLIFNKNPHNYHTRNQDRYIDFRIKNEFVNKCIAYRIVTIINSCPHIIKDKLYTHGLSGLMIYMKRFFIENYSNNCNLVNCFVCSHV